MFHSGSIYSKSITSIKLIQQYLIKEHINEQILSIMLLSKYTEYDAKIGHASTPGLILSKPETVGQLER